MKVPGVAILLLVSFLSSGCSMLVSRAADSFGRNLTSAILNQDDPETVKAGMPSYMLLMDSFVEGSPDSPAMLGAAATLYASYAGLFTGEDIRASRLTRRARDYASTAMCLSYVDACGWDDMRFRDFEASLSGTDESHAEVLYTYGFSLLVYIRAHASDMRALAKLPHAEAIVARHIELSGDTAAASAYTYLGMLQTLRPPAMGGQPEAARSNYEKAIELTDGRDLSVHVAFADSYAKLMFDRDLFDRLIDHVLDTSPYADDLTLTNVLAQEQALHLKTEADTYF